MIRRKTFHSLLAALALMLGLAHIAFGMFVFKALNLDSFWFLSFGLAMIVTALANFTSAQPVILRLQNGLTLSFILALAALAPQPQVIVGCGLFSGLLILSFFRPQTTTAD